MDALYTSQIYLFPKACPSGDQVAKRDVQIAIGNGIVSDIVASDNRRRYVVFQVLEGQDSFLVFLGNDIRGRSSEILHMDT